jgi:glucokinase
MANRKKTMYLGWDVGGTKSAAVVGSGEGTILDRQEWPSNAPAGPEAMLADFLVHAKAMIAAHKGVAMVGVSVGGPLNTLTGEVLSPPHLPGWDHVPLAAILQRKLGLPVVVEHDAAACLEAEWLWGAAAGTTHAAYLTCGTGCGCGVLIDGRILRGPHGQSPEIGHVRLADEGPELFGKSGCVESFCGGQGIGLSASWMFPKLFDRSMTAKDLHDLVVRHVAQPPPAVKPGPRAKAARAVLPGAMPKSARACLVPAAHGQDARATAARAVLEHSAKRTGQVCSILADLIAPQVIVLGSLARYFGPWWVELVRQEFVRESLPINADHARIVPAKLGKKLQDLSAIAPCVFRGSGR